MEHVNLDRHRQLIGYWRICGRSSILRKQPETGWEAGPTVPRTSKMLLFRSVERSQKQIRVQWVLQIREQPI